MFVLAQEPTLKTIAKIWAKLRENVFIAVSLDPIWLDDIKTLGIFIWKADGFHYKSIFPSWESEITYQDMRFER